MIMHILSICLLSTSISLSNPIHATKTVVKYRRQYEVKKFHASPVFSYIFYIKITLAIVSYFSWSSFHLIFQELGLHNAVVALTSEVWSCY
jgi:hypothetical protein